MKLQYFSDLHLEFGDAPIPAIVGDVVVAAGDISTGTEGVEWLKQLDAPVVYVAGNHEFYNHEYDATRAAIAEAAAGSQVHFLDKDEVVIGDVRFIGCTLWTDFNRRSAAIYRVAHEFMNDFNLIRYGDRIFMPSDMAQLGEQAQDWLAARLAQPTDCAHTVVVSHHAPSQNSWDDDRKPAYRPAYCNSLEPLLAQHDVDAWIHGHVHAPADYTVHGTRVVCNPRGYVGYGTVPRFSLERTLEL